MTGRRKFVNGGVITLAQGHAGLKFTPDANLFSPASSFFFTVQAGIGDSDLASIALALDREKGFVEINCGPAAKRELQTLTLWLSLLQMKNKENKK